jgi:serine/threonine-protein kinase
MDRRCMGRGAPGKVTCVTIEARDSLLADRYRIGGQLGTGGTGRVFRAIDERLNRPVAIKVLRASLATPMDRARCEREARAAARVDHPNIVKVFDVDTLGDDFFIVMELCAGSTLAARIARQPLTTAETIALAMPLLDALGCAHAAGVIHRDIKPSNILFTHTGVPKLADFGIAQVLDENTMFTGTGEVIGTAPYLAPERLAGGHATIRTDLYALGVVLYEAVAGRRPYDGQNFLAIAHAIARARPDPLPIPRGVADQRLYFVIERSLQPDPGDRFRSAEEMVATLGSPVSSAALPAEPATEPTSPTAQMPVSLAPESELADTGTPTRLELRPEADSTDPKGPRSRWLRLSAAAILAALIIIAVAVAQSGSGNPPASTSTSTSTSTPTTAAVEIPSPPSSTDPTPPTEPPQSDKASGADRSDTKDQRESRGENAKGRGKE